MKRPRRPAKRKPVSKKIVKRKKPTKAFRKIKAGLDEALAHARKVHDWTPEEAAIFDQPEPPAGYAYQWSPFSRIEYMRSRGWSQVPYSRHTHMPQSTNFDGYIVYRDTALFQISAGVVRDDIERGIWLAKEQTRDFDDAIGREGGRFTLLSPSFMVSEEYEGYGGPPVDVNLTITVRMPSRWCDAAGVTHLAYGEYLRRRLLMSGMLIAADEATGVFFPFELHARKVD